MAELIHSCGAVQRQQQLWTDQLVPVVPVDQVDQAVVAVLAAARRGGRKKGRRKFRLKTAPQHADAIHRLKTPP
jgi:ABC-type transporter Mla MlaB component